VNGCSATVSTPSARTEAGVTSPVQWSHAIHDEADGTCRVEVIDEDGVSLPVGRQLTRAQAERLLERIQREARQERRPIKDVIRDPYFMAATVITIKRT
jgi:hypothetical protein